MKNPNEIYVAFHIGRGGRFYNSGHVTYMGEMDIHKLIELNSNDLFYRDKDKRGRFCSPYYSDLNGNEIITIKETKSNVGILEFDRQYNTDICKLLSDCSERELQLINECNTIYKSIELTTNLESLLANVM
jgi:hypothetical protein